MAECPPHDWFNALLTGCLCVGLVVSYIPQHLRIIQTKSSEGLSPAFLLLGTVSAASALLNMITLQAPLLRCCVRSTFGRCVETSAGVIQLGLQWVCFSFVFVLYMVYFPTHLKQAPGEVTHTAEWRLSIVLAWITTLHFNVAFFVTLYLLLVSSPYTSTWAIFLGITAAGCAMFQYIPQLVQTYRSRLVGALSIPMMCIQTPGGILMVLSIVLRPGTNWTSWITFAVAAILQGLLLTMCLVWKVRQRKAGVDDFGKPIAVDERAPLLG